MGSYNDEQEFCSYFKIVERGPNYKFLNINSLWKFLSVERSSRCFHDGQPSYPWMTFLYWDNISRLGQTEDSPIFGSPSLKIIGTQNSKLIRIRNLEKWYL